MLRYKDDDVGKNPWLYIYTEFHEKRALHSLMLGNRRTGLAFTLLFLFFNSQGTLKLTRILFSGCMYAFLVIDTIDGGYFPTQH
jgi:hypothetical protein